MVGLFSLLFIPKEQKNLVRYVSLVFTFVTFILSVILYLNFDNSIAGMQPQFNISIPWIEHFHINYALSVDGISLPMVVLTAALFFICILCSWKIEKSIKAYHILLLLLETSVFGVFLAMDFFLFYVFWEVMLIPMFFLIGIWGGENKEYAAVKFFLYTFFGSVILLVGIVALYFETGRGPESFNILALQGGHFIGKNIHLFGTTWAFNEVFFWAMFIGFAIKVPVFSLSYLASPCSRPGPHRRFGDSSRCFVKNGYLRFSQNCLPHFSRGLCPL